MGGTYRANGGSIRGHFLGDRLHLKPHAVKRAALKQNQHLLVYSNTAGRVLGGTIPRPAPRQSPCQVNRPGCALVRFSISSCPAFVSFLVSCLKVSFSSHLFALSSSEIFLWHQKEQGISQGAGAWIHLVPGWYMKCGSLFSRVSLGRALRQILTSLLQNAVSSLFSKLFKANGDIKHYCNKPIESRNITNP